MMKWNLFVLTASLCSIYVLGKPDARIIGGQDAVAGEFPYAAAIYITTGNGNYFCSGSLLTNRWILTAGQCVNGATTFVILLGSHKLSANTTSLQRLATDSYVLHPEFNPVTLENDIGLIELRLPVTITTYIRQVNLPLNPLPPSAVGIAFGWGQTSDTNSSLSDTLNYVTLYGVSDNECRLTYGNQITENMVCFAGSYNEGTCLGDSGSPIIQHLNRGYTVVVAVASFFSANGCQTVDPSGYTNVYPYNDWIRNVTGAP